MKYRKDEVKTGQSQQSGSKFIKLRKNTVSETELCECREKAKKIYKN